jgi:hypothetical protein
MVIITQILMDMRIGFSSLSFYMTLGAQIISGRERHHPRVVCGSAPDMTAQTLNRKIFISLINGFFSNRVGRMGHPFVTLAAHTDRDIFLRNEEYIVRCMWGMTARAIAGFNRFTQIFIFRIFYRPLLQCHRVLMTAAAHFELGGIQKLFFLRAMGVVAVQTADLVG